MGRSNGKSKAAKSRASEKTVNVRMRETMSANT